MPSSTREGELLCGLLAGTPASTALTDAHGWYFVSSGDIGTLCQGLDSLIRSSGGSILNFCLTLCISGLCTPFSLVALSPNHCYHVTFDKCNVLVL